MINVGIIGMGQSGWGLHAEPLCSMPEYNVVAVCDQSDSRANSAAKRFDAQPHADALTMLASPDVDLVVV